ncbi:hypothetical protein A33Q_1982 [Indibacter alkaliphilus LW1]|uniref:Uncharacterized protein n=1 Tax=Indibacter alkaliphilus (strain CCUG 57479 / KCTC 22604 / LW1) TaxID=1189612 RepID=S2DDV2_INDAL|nr:hypothetical protein A33Q_1982 [Indibacter alkaliphilus LW1]
MLPTCKAVEIRNWSISLNFDEFNQRLHNKKGKPIRLPFLD